MAKPKMTAAKIAESIEKFETLTKNVASMKSALDNKDLVAQLPESFVATNKMILRTSEETMNDTRRKIVRSMLPKNVDSMSVAEIRELFTLLKPMLEK